MVNSGSVNGIPATSSHYLLTDVCGPARFHRVVISDWNDVAKLLNNYHVASDYEHAIALAVNAGVT